MTFDSDAPPSGVIEVETTGDDACDEEEDPIVAMYHNMKVAVANDCIIHSVEYTAPFGGMNGMIKVKYTVELFDPNLKAVFSYSASDLAWKNLFTVSNNLMALYAKKQFGSNDDITVTAQHNPPHIRCQLKNEVTEGIVFTATNY